MAFAEAPAGVELVRGTLDIAEFRLPPRLIVNGRGFGHGVGMSQWGAQGMARAGHSFDEILRHYYQGIELERVGEEGGSPNPEAAVVSNRIQVLRDLQRRQGPQG